MLRQGRSGLLAGMLGGWLAAMAVPACAQEGGWRLFEVPPRENPYDEPLVTDRPDYTEATQTVGTGVVQMESGYTYYYFDDEATGDISQSHTAPEMLWRIGIADPIELRIGYTYEWSRTEAGPFVTNSDGGNDLYLGAKLAFRAQEDWKPNQSMIIQSTAPSGDAAFTTGNTEFGINYLYSWDLPNEWGVSCSSGFDTATDAGDKFLEWHQSISLDLPVTDDIGMFIEYFGIYNYGINSGDYSTNYIDGGFTYLVNYNLQLDIRWGKGLNDAADDFFTGAGASFRF